MSFKEFIARDLELDDNFDLLIKDGDFVVTPSDDHTQEIIIISSKGSFRFAPMVGVDIYTYLNSTGQADSIKRDIQEQLRLDGYRVDTIEFADNNQIKIIAKRIK